MSLKVVLVDDNRGRSALLRQALVDSGVEVSACLEDCRNLLAEVNRLAPDLVLIDMDSPNRDVLESLRTVSRDNPKPVVLFTEKSDHFTIESAIKAGVSAYVVDDINAKRLQTILEVAIARFREFQALRDELAEVKGKLADRKDIDKAKGLLMKRKNLTEDEAYQMLRRMAMDRNLRLGDVARSIIMAADLL